eukprot:8324583-Pyramimonas_sp.AAC.1
MQREMFMQISSSLRAWHPAIVESCAESRGLLETYVEWLDACAASLVIDDFTSDTWVRTSSRGGKFRLDSQFKGQYSATFLIHCLVFSSHVRSVSVYGVQRNPLQLIMERAM